MTIGNACPGHFVGRRKSSLPLTTAATRWLTSRSYTQELPLPKPSLPLPQFPLYSGAHQYVGYSSAALSLIKSRKLCLHK